uniref:Acyl-CoA desaturase n=1 Tax=Lygus hesperus TaxID=30085 RepID=A0A0A9XP43_LYGHE
MTIRILESLCSNRGCLSSRELPVYDELEMLDTQNSITFLQEAGTRMDDRLNLQNGKTNGHAVIEKSNGALPRDKLNGKTNGVAAASVPPDNDDVRVKIRANMLAVQDDFHDYKWEIKWTHVYMLSFVHIWAVLGLVSVPYMKWQTWGLRFAELVIAGLGVTAGAHRLYCHRAYKAKLPLHLFPPLGIFPCRSEYTL